MVLIAVPSRTLRENVRNAAASLSGSAVVVSATKGLEIESGKRMSQVLADELPAGLRSGVCALSGPNLAREIIEGKPSTTVAASRNVEAAERAQSILTSSVFRVYTNVDIVGVELGGSLKNIIALGAGVIDGLRYGDNTKAAFMTRGLAEIARLAVGAGADPMTLSGLAGMGDLIATCSSRLSRNHHVGEQLASGKSLDEIRAGMKNVAEGIDTTAAAVKLSKEVGVEMPIAAATYEVLFNGAPIQRAVADLLGRAPSPE
jgi:glycerol-3-phosphate dehydrogenase (NAD(P)+)